MSRYLLYNKLNNINNFKLLFGLGNGKLTTFDDLNKSFSLETLQKLESYVNDKNMIYKVFFKYKTNECMYNI